MLPCGPLRTRCTRWRVDGNYVAAPVWDGPALLVANLPFHQVREGQLTLDVSGHYHRPDCFAFEVTPGPRRS